MDTCSHLKFAQTRNNILKRAVLYFIQSTMSNYEASGTAGLTRLTLNFRSLIFHWNLFNPNSIISKVNQNAPLKPTTVYEGLYKAKEVSDHS